MEGIWQDLTLSFNPLLYFRKRLLTLGPTFDGFQHSFHFENSLNIFAGVYLELRFMDYLRIFILSPRSFNISIFLISPDLHSPLQLSLSSAAVSLQCLKGNLSLLLTTLDQNSMKKCWNTSACVLVSFRVFL